MSPCPNHGRTCRRINTAGCCHSLNSRFCTSSLYQQGSIINAMRYKVCSRIFCKLWIFITLPPARATPVLSQSTIGWNQTKFGTWSEFHLRPSPSCRGPSVDATLPSCGLHRCPSLLPASPRHPVRPRPSLPNACRAHGIALRTPPSSSRYGGRRLSPS